jgi:sugar phosphate isomerase/epimerase
MNHCHRRAFLKATAVSLTAAGIAQPAYGSSMSRRKFTMNLFTNLIGVKATPLEAISLAKQYGYESVTPIPWSMAKMPEEELDELVGALNANGLKWGAAQFWPFFTDDESKFAEKRKQIAAQAGVLKKAGVTRSFTWTMSSSNSLTYMSNFRLHVRCLTEIGKVLADNGLRIGVEYLGTRTLAGRNKFPFIRTLAGMKDLTDATGLDNVGLTLDAWHWFQAGDTEEDIARLSNRDVVNADICDAPSGMAREEMPDSPRALPCTTGVIDIRAFLSGLLKIGYDGPVGTEPFDRSLRKMSTDQAMTTASTAMKKAFSLVD